METEKLHVLRSHLFTEIGAKVFVEEIPCTLQLVGEVFNKNPAEKIFTFVISHRIGMKEVTRAIKVKHEQRFVVLGWSFKFYSHSMAYPIVDLLH